MGRRGLLLRLPLLSAAAAEAEGFASEGQEDPAPPEGMQVFPRRKERDPYRCVLCFVGVGETGRVLLGWY